MKIIVDSKENIAARVSSMISGYVAEKPTASIAFVAGDTMHGIYAELANENADFSECEAFNVCEYVGLGADDEKSCAYQLENELYSKLGITKTHAPRQSAPEGYDEEIAACGGIDLAILGIGLNGHIGFNEPTTLYDSYTHIAQLTDSTKRMKADQFSGEDKVPTHAVTMGLKTICNAKNVILVAFGAEKADIVHKLVYGKTSTYVPAAMLQMHMNMTLCLDEEAAAKLN